MASYTLGSLVRLSATFKVNGALTDPTTVTCKVKTPDGTETAYTYAAAQVVKDSQGAYHYDFSVGEQGWHYYAFAGTGTCVASSEGHFIGVSDL